MKLSIIIPVYNQEQYLEACLDSCLEQDLSYSEYEIIVVNDGSTDGSLDILNQYASRYPNVKVVSQENQRQGIARNTGLKIASGDYVWFIDSDDYIEKNCLGELFQKGHTAEIVLFSSCFHVKYESTILIPFHTPSSIEEIPLCTINFTSLAPMTWAYLYKRTFLSSNHFEFVENIWEDTEFTAKVFYHVKEIETYHKTVYYYRQHANSDTGRISLQKCSAFYEIAWKIEEYKMSLAPLTDEWDLFYTRYIVELLNVFLYHCQNTISKERKSLIYEFQHNKILLNEYKKQGGLKKTIKVFLFVHFEALLFFYFRVWKKVKFSINK
jgi:glycosyltransferase involved in cell wall biosynthesis